MNTRRLPTDATLRAMLARRGAQAVPDDLADDIRAAVEATRQRRRPAWTWLLPPSGADPSIRRAWIVALVGLLVVVLSGAAFVGSELMRRPELALVPLPSAVPAPTNVRMESAEPSAAPALTSVRPIDRINELAFGPDGSAWLATGAGVAHWDITAGTATLYGQADGLPTTAAVHVVVAPDGVVWASGGTTWVARFDGSWTAFTDFGATRPGVDFGDIAAGPDGALWLGVTDAASGTPLLLRYDGAWHSYELPEAIDANPWSFRLFVDADGAVWAGSWDRFFRFDGTRWTTYTRASTHLPRDPLLAAVGTDGSAWVNLEADGCVVAPGGGEACATPAAGVARLDEGAWTVYTTADGLPAEDVDLVSGDDGSMWATGSGTLARLDGARWASLATVPDGHAAAVAPDGALWLTSPAGLLRYDGSSLTRQALPSVSIPATLPPLTLTPVSGPTLTPSALGRITWRIYEAVPGHDLIWSMAGTPSGPVALDDFSDLRWLSPSGSLEGMTLPIAPWRVTSLGDDIVVHGQGASRLRWDGSRWVVAAEPTGLTGFVEQLAAGQRGTVATGGERIYHSADGRSFEPAAQLPDASVGEAAARAAGLRAVCPAVGGGSWPGEGRLGPLIATRSGFVVLAPALAADWNRTPWCTPLLWSSPDGSTWSLVSGRSPFGDGAIVQTTTSWGGRHVAVGQVGDSYAAWVSDDGLAWQRVPLERAAPCDQPCSGLMAGVEASTAGWLAWSWDGAAWTSHDGEAWEPLRGWPALRGGYESPALGLGPETILATGSLPGPWHTVIAIGTIER